MIRTTCVVALLLIAQSSPAPRGVVPLLQAHAHNDYLHDRPLLDALDQGFASVEADVFLVGDKLCVAHEADKIAPKPDAAIALPGPAPPAGAGQ